MSERTLFIELFQPFAQYRNPFTFYYAQTFPLPPKSTIIGMLQNAVGDWYGTEFKNNWKLKISVHGGFESVFWNYQQLIKGELTFTEDGVWINTNSEMKKRYGKRVYLPLYGDGITAQRTPVYQQELFNGHLYIFIRGDFSFLNKIKNSLNNLKKILYLGRSEDIVFIKNVDYLQQREEVSWEEIGEDLVLTLPTFIRRKIKENGRIKKELPITNQKYPVYSIPVSIRFKNREGPVKHKSEITKQTEREIEFEDVIYTGTNFEMELESTSDKHIEGIEVFEIPDKNIKEIRIIKEFGWL